MVESVVVNCPGSVWGLGVATDALLVAGLAVDCEDSPVRGSLLVEEIGKLEECAGCVLELVVVSDPTGFVVDPAASVVFGVSVVLVVLIRVVPPTSEAPVVEVVLAFGPVLGIDDVLDSGAPVVVEAVFVLCRCLF